MAVSITFLALWADMGREGAFPFSFGDKLTTNSVGCRSLPRGRSVVVAPANAAARIVLGEVTYRFIRAMNCDLATSHPSSGCRWRAEIEGLKKPPGARFVISQRQN